jgi:molecular chaperone GrpE
MEEFRDKALRAQAEFENSKKRLQAQQASALLRASERVVSAMIPAMDDIDLAIAHAQESGNDMLAGLQAIQSKLVAVFAAEQVELIDPTGEIFDHDTAQAVQMIEDASAPDQTVAQVLQKGYVMAKGSDNQRVLRPAMVVVSTNPNS